MCLRSSRSKHTEKAGTVGAVKITPCGWTGVNSKARVGRQKRSNSETREQSRSTRSHWEAEQTNWQRGLGAQRPEGTTGHRWNTSGAEPTITKDGGRKWINQQTHKEMARALKERRATPRLSNPLHPKLALPSTLDLHSFKLLCICKDMTQKVKGGSLAILLNPSKTFLESYSYTSGSLPRCNLLFPRTAFDTIFKEMRPGLFE